MGASDKAPQRKTAHHCAPLAWKWILLCGAPALELGKLGFEFFAALGFG
jgi:hypothetical protein